MKKLILLTVVLFLFPEKVFAQTYINYSNNVSGTTATAEYQSENSELTEAEPEQEINTEITEDTDAEIEAEENK